MTGKAKNSTSPAESEELKDKTFLDAYQKLCEKHGRGLDASPAWRPRRSSKKTPP